MPRAGTGSRSTRPAAATARARSARCASSRASCRSARSTRARSRPTSCATAGAWPAARRPRCDLVIDVPPLQTRPKAATVGVGRQVILRPSVQKRYLELAEPTLQDQASDLERILAAMDDLELRVGVDVVRTLPKLVRECEWKLTAVVVDDELVGVEAGDTTARMFGIAFDLGTTTVVATLLDLSTGTPVAVRSILNRQQPYGADVIRRISATMMDPTVLPKLQELAQGTLADLVAEVLEQGEVVARRGLRGRARRQRDDDAAAARHRSRAGRRGAVHHGRLELPAHARLRLRRDRAPARARPRLPGARRLRRRRHRLGPAGLRHDARQAAAPVHRRRHELRDRARQRRAPAHDGRARRAGLRGGADPLRHARRRRRDRDRAHRRRRGRRSA